MPHYELMLSKLMECVTTLYCKGYNAKSAQKKIEFHFTRPSIFSFQPREIILGDLLEWRQSIKMVSTLRETQ